jgi:hypothetical protein
MKIVLVYVNTSKEVGDVGHLKVFANEALTSAFHRAVTGIALIVRATVVTARGTCAE